MNDKYGCNRDAEITQEDLDTFNTLAGNTSEAWFNKDSNLPVDQVKLREARMFTTQDSYNELTKRAEEMREDYRKDTGMDMPIETAIVVTLMHEIQVLSDEVDRYKELIKK